MDNNQFELLMTVLIRVADALDRIAPTTPAAPNYEYPIENFPTFNWETIGAVVEQSDQYGAGVVRWGEKRWMRRSPQNKYGAAIWFSRATSKDDQGKVQYERLVTFKSYDTEVEPISSKASSLIL